MIEMLKKIRNSFDPTAGYEGYFLSASDIEWLIGKVEQQHFDILALESNLNGNDKIIEEQQQEIEEWKEKEFQACSKHHEFIDDIERIEEESDKIILEKTDRILELEEENKMLKEYKKVLMENSVVRSETIERYEKALNEICRYVNYVGEPIEVYNIAKKALKGE